MMRFSEILGYEVLATLGHGARSTIYAVKDSANNVFALKRVVKNSDADQRYLDQAILEHKNAQKLNHPTLRKSFKLVRHRQVLRVSEVDVVMEMVDGITLEAYKPKDMVELAKLCCQVSQGLLAMHEAGLVHADIKPNNILVTGDEAVKIIDFGQSCEVGTVKERIQGTPDYIAPEQVKRRRITEKTDVFNLGATMYWLVTGTHVPTMMPKGDPGTTLRTTDAFPAPRELNPKATPALSMLVMNCLERDPKERPAMSIVCDRLELAIAQLERDDDLSQQPKPRQRSAV